MNTMSQHHHQQQQLHQHLQQFSLPAHYDPIEYRRVHYPTSALAAHPPIPTDELFQHVERLKAHENTLFSQEYDSIDPGQQFTWETAVTDINRQKNRYANVIVYDHSRVILSRLNNNNNETMTSGHLFGGSDSGTSTPLPSPSSDYINASFCDGYRKSAAYIATQGPLPATYGDFWRMVWEQGTSTVVMMTKLEERQRLKCDQYYPSKGTEVYDNCMQVCVCVCATNIII
jgi:protein tyrosine phosphatase